MTNSLCTTLFLNAKTPKFALSRLAQITTNFRSEMLILENKSPKFGFALEAQIMTYFHSLRFIFLIQDHRIIFFIMIFWIIFSGSKKTVIPWFWSWDFDDPVILILVILMIPWFQSWQIYDLMGEFLWSCDPNGWNLMILLCWQIKN